MYNLLFGWYTNWYLLTAYDRNPPSVHNYTFPILVLISSSELQHIPEHRYTMYCIVESTYLRIFFCIYTDCKLVEEYNTSVWLKKGASRTIQKLTNIICFLGIHLPFSLTSSKPCCVSGFVNNSRHTGLLVSVFVHPHQFCSIKGKLASLKRNHTLQRKQCSSAANQCFLLKHVCLFLHKEKDVALSILKEKRQNMKHD